MSDSQSSAFISYHHNDIIIGTTLKNQLAFLASCGSQGKAAVKSFLDSKDIHIGDDWKTIITDNLCEMDWLVVIFTGEQSVYCGYEIGTFWQLRATQQGKRRILALHDVGIEQLPLVLRDSENAFVTNVDDVIDIERVTVSAQEVLHWYECDVGRFLVDFCKYKELYVPGDAENPGDYTNNIALAAKRIATAFALARGTDVKSETPTQIGFELTIKGVGGGSIDKIPDDAIIIGTSLFFSLIGLSLSLSLSGNRAPSTSWGELKRLLDITSGRNVPWVHKVEADVVRAIDSRNVSGADVTLRGENGKVYRPILERHQLFVNGDRRFYLLFVETLDRRFIGSERSSLLLTSLILASRWHFSYFEKWADTQRNFGEQIPLQNLADGCKQLLYNMEWIQLEAAQLGADDPRRMIEAFGLGCRARVERFFEDWEEAKKGLFTVLPGPYAEITEANRKEVGAAVLTFLESNKSRNQEFLKLAIQAYSDEVTPKLGRTNVPR